MRGSAPLDGHSAHARPAPFAELMGTSRQASCPATPEDPQKWRTQGGGWYGHWMRITAPEELDDELLGWLRESYHQMGMQERPSTR